MKGLDERGIVFEYANVVIIVAVICFMWIILNEVVFQLGSVAETLVTTEPGKTLTQFAITCWRIFPFILVFGTFGWALYRAWMVEPFEQFG